MDESKEKEEVKTYFSEQFSDQFLKESTDPDKKEGHNAQG